MVRSYASPRTLMPSSVGVPPLECSRGTTPNLAKQSQTPASLFDHITFRICRDICAILPELILMIHS